MSGSARVDLCDGCGMSGGVVRAALEWVAIRPAFHTFGVIVTMRVCRDNWGDVTRQTGPRQLC